MSFIVREGFDQQLPRRWHLASIVLHLKPFAHFIRKASPRRAIGQHMSDAVGQMSGKRQSCSHIARDIGSLLFRGADDQVEVFDLLDLKRHTGKGEGVARA